MRNAPIILWWLLPFACACGCAVTSKGAPESSATEGDTSPRATSETEAADASSDDVTVEPAEGARPDTAEPDPDTPLTFAQLAASYGIIETVAGRGEFGSKRYNGWEERFEGGPATDAELSRPHITLGDAEGNLFVADKDAHAIRKISPDGRIVTVAGTGEAGDDGDEPRPGSSSRLSSPNGLWIGPAGQLYILDLGNSKIRKLDTEGQLSTLFALPESAGTGRGLWVSDDARLAYVSAGTSLLRWTAEGGATTHADGFVSLGNLHVSPQGELAVADRGGHRVYSIGSDGTKTPIAGNGDTQGGGAGSAALETGLDEVRGIFFHPRGGYFLATHKGDQVWYVDAEGTIHLFVDGDGGDHHEGDGERHAPGEKISEPRAVTMDPKGNVIITENDLGFVRRVRLR